MIDRSSPLPAPDVALPDYVAADRVPLANGLIGSQDGLRSERRAAHHFPTANSGRKVRALIASYLL